MFKLFGFVRNSQQLNKNGIGLGLVILDKITNQFGSKITFKSNPNEGSTFTFQFQLEQQLQLDYVRQKGQEQIITEYFEKYIPNISKNNKIFNIEQVEPKMKQQSTKTNINRVISSKIGVMGNSVRKM